ncbi:MAG: ferritin-like domain-containing protein, partial [Candidatus Nitrosopolaris sp.]
MCKLHHNELSPEAKDIGNKMLVTMMRISTEMAKAINEQISYEASSANTYIAIGSWCERIGYDGSAAFFFEQAAEEN